MSEELTFSLWLYALIIAFTFLYGLLRWHWNLWLRDGIIHMPVASHALCLGALTGQGKAPATNDVLQRAYEKFNDTHLPFCGLGFQRWLQPVVINFDYYLERLVLRRKFDYYADGGGGGKSDLSTFDDYWLRRNFYFPIGGWGALQEKLTTEFQKADFTALLPNIWQLAENELIQAIDTALAKSEDGILSLIELQDICVRYIVDVTAKCLFNLQSQSLNAIDAANVEFEQFYSQFLLMLQKHKSCDDLQEKLLPISCLDMWHKHQLQMSTFTFCNKILPQILQSNGEYHNHNDLSSLLLALNTSTNGTKILATKATIKASTNMLLLFMGAIARSLANMTLTIYELSRKQHTQAELYDEILEKDAERYKFSALRDWTYLEHVINETQRSYCTVPRCLVSKCSQDYATVYPGYKLHKNTIFIVPLHEYCHKTILYPNPNEWDADRFAVVELMDSMNQLIRTYCGQTEETDLDELLTSIGLIAILKRFHFTLSEVDCVPLEFDNTVPVLLLQNGPYLKVTRRQL